MDFKFQVLAAEGLGKYCDSEFVGTAAREMREALDMTPEEMNLAAHQILSNEHSLSLIGSSNGSIFGGSAGGLGGAGSGGVGGLGGSSSIRNAFGGSGSGPSSLSPQHQPYSGTLNSPPIPDNRLRRVATVTTTNNNNKSQVSQNNSNSLNVRANANSQMNMSPTGQPVQQQSPLRGQGNQTYSSQHPHCKLYIQNVFLMEL